MSSLISSPKKNIKIEIFWAHIVFDCLSSGTTLPTLCVDLYILFLSHVSVILYREGPLDVLIPVKRDSTNVL
jgi:hypothetical protein